jgi:hypothetical protein
MSGIGGIEHQDRDLRSLLAWVAVVAVAIAAAVVEGCTA